VVPNPFEQDQNNTNTKPFKQGKTACPKPGTYTSKASAKVSGGRGGKDGGGHGQTREKPKKGTRGGGIECEKPKFTGLLRKNLMPEKVTNTK